MGGGFAAFGDAAERFEEADLVVAHRIDLAARGKALRGATPFTVAFANGDGQLYRARFGGFTNQDKAVNACKTLKRKGFACWASLQ